MFHFILSLENKSKKHSYHLPSSPANIETTGYDPNSIPSTPERDKTNKTVINLGDSNKLTLGSHEIKTMSPKVHAIRKFFNRIK